MAKHAQLSGNEPAHPQKSSIDRDAGTRSDLSDAPDADALYSEVEGIIGRAVVACRRAGTGPQAACGDLDALQRVARALAAMRKPVQATAPLQDAPTGASDDEE